MTNNSTSITNGFIEGCNNKIKVLKSRSADCTAYCA
ncbi:MAG: transposase [Ruminococcus sp.]